MAGCTISQLGFTIFVIIWASKWIVGGERLQDGTRLPPIWAYMDDIMMLTTTAPAVSQVKWQSEMGKDESETQQS